MLIRPTNLSGATSWFIYGVIALAFALTLYSSLGSRPLNYFHYASSNSSATTTSPIPLSDHITFWKALAAHLEAARPQCPPVNVSFGEMSASDRNWEPLVEKKRPERLNLTEQDELELTRRHRQMRLAARELAPLLPVGGDEYGIVTTGGLALVPVLLVSLRMLRRTGCTLPMEVFLGDRTEYEEVKDVCENVLPGLNAKCLVISDVYSKADVDPPNHFQFKMLSILFSNFKHVLFLDADAFPAHDPTPLLHSAPYTTHGLVTWPGFYANAASPHFYHIASLPVPPVSRGTESGMLLLNKAHHAESIMMMAYYNYYGPQYYYPLQAQGGPGQGDKETFSAGAMAVGAPGPFYGVKTPVLALGNHVGDEFVFAGAAQADPLQDYAYAPPEANHILSKYEWNESDRIGGPDTLNSKARAFFVHTVSHGTKIDSAKILRKGGLAYMEDESKWHRIWGKEEWVVEKFGFDVEKTLWECVQEEACRTDQAACADVKRFREKIFGTSV